MSTAVYLDGCLAQAFFGSWARDSESIPSHTYKMTTILSDTLESTFVHLELNSMELWDERHAWEERYCCNFDESKLLVCCSLSLK